MESNHIIFFSAKMVKKKPTGRRRTFIGASPFKVGNLFHMPTIYRVVSDRVVLANFGRKRNLRLYWANAGSRKKFIRKKWKFHFSHCRLAYKKLEPLFRLTAEGGRYGGGFSEGNANFHFFCVLMVRLCWVNGECVAKGWRRCLNYEVFK